MPENKTFNSLRSFFHGFLKKMSTHGKDALSLVGGFFSKCMAYLLYMELWVIHFSTIGYIGPTLLFLAMIFGFSGTHVNWLKIACVLYVGQVVSGIVMFKALFQSPKFEAWIYKHVGEDRVREKVYRSPAMKGAAARAGLIGVGAIVVKAGMGAADRFETRGRAADADTAAVEQYDRKLRVIKEWEERQLAMPGLTKEDLVEIAQQREIRLDAADAQLESRYNTGWKIRQATSKSSVDEMVDYFTKENPPSPSQIWDKFGGG